MLHGSSVDPAATISTPIRIDSILSPPDPSDADELLNLPTKQASAKRKFEDPPSLADVPANPQSPSAASPPSRRQSTAELKRGGGGGGAARVDGDDEVKVMAVGNPEIRKSTKVRAPMRSSVACIKCRSSKIKCENIDGVSPCQSCLKAGKECKFPTPDPAPAKRTKGSTTTGVKQERDPGPERKKLKKIDDISRVHKQRATVYAEEVLAAPFLTEDLWEQLLDLYKLHFAPELSFLHLPSIKETLGRKFRASQPEESEVDPDHNLVLLGVLTLTARFHPDLVNYIAHLCSNQPGNARTRPSQTHFDPAAASDYYAEILAMALGSGGRGPMRIASVDRVGALLMLGLYEWSQTQPNTGAITAWMYGGQAIRLAQFEGLGFVDARASTANASHQMNSEHLALQKEIKRRTMFSCFILDRMLACGKERVSVIQRGELSIQLPCSEDKFDLAMEVETNRLTDQVKHGTDDSVLGRFIRLVDIWGEISKFSSQGGRLEEKFPPWNDRTRFYQLSKVLGSFESSLPGTFTFSRSNYFKHENHQASSVYVLLHMLRCVSLIMLHREYVPFVPIRCKEPEGPLDHPTFPESPDGWWRQSAEKMFKAAREVVELIEICQRKNRLPQSTIVIFAVWTAAFVGLYGNHFRQMDTERHMMNSVEKGTRGNPTVGVFTHGPTAIAFQTLHSMSARLKMAATYVRILRGMDKYFETVKQDYHRFSESNRLTDKRPLSVRQGGTGGGLEEYQLLFNILKDFGTFRKDEQADMDLSERSRAGVAERTVSEDTNGSRPNANAPQTTTAGSFRAINHIPTASLSDTHRVFPLSGDPATGQNVTYADSWRHYSNLEPQPSPTQLQPYPAPNTISDSGPHRLEAHEQILTREECEGFWKQLGQAEFQRFGMEDLRIFTSRESQPLVNDMPFAESSYIPSMGDSSYQLLQLAEDFEYTPNST